MKKPARTSAQPPRAPTSAPQADHAIRSFFATIARMSDRPSRRAAAPRQPKVKQA